MLGWNAGKLPRLSGEHRGRDNLVGEGLVIDRDTQVYTHDGNADEFMYCCRQAPAV